MPFLKRASPITRYRLTGKPSRELLQQAAEHLARKGFRPIDTLPDELSAGWVNFDDPTDSEWRTATPDRVAHLVWTLRQDKRTVPPKLLEVRTRAEVKKYLERRRDEIQEKVLIPFVNRDEKAEIRERVYLALMSQAVPVPVMADVIWIYPADPAQAEIWLCATTGALRGKFQFLFGTTFDLPLRQVDPWTPCPEGTDNWPENIGEHYLTWLYEHDGGSLDVAGVDLAVNFDRLTLSDVAGDVTIKAVTGESDPEEVKHGLENGLLVHECALTLGISGDAYKVQVKGAEFDLRVETTFWTYDREDPDGSFADKVLSLERLFATWDRLYRLWLVQTGRLPEEGRKAGGKKGSAMTVIKGRKNAR
jgi:hypothetical protein